MQSVMQHSFSRAPVADIQRSSFNRSHGHKTTFDASYLIPVFWDEALPGDTFNLNCAAFCRLATPIHPIMDNLYMDVQFFSVPLRQLWTNFRKFMGERIDPADSIDFITPKMNLGSGVAVHSLADYLGLPWGFAGANIINSFPFRAYNHIYNEWYRDQNLIDSVLVDLDDGPDTEGTDYVLRRRGKRHDYFTSCLPWPQKGGTASTLPLGTSAPVVFNTGATYPVGNGSFRLTATGVSQGIPQLDSATAFLQTTSAPGADAGVFLAPPDGVLIADLTTATAATIDQLYQAFALQRFLVNDARGGTRYPEIIKTHFGVEFYDPSYRPEYLGGLSTSVNIHPVPQTSETGTTPQGNLSAFGTAGFSGGGFTKSFTEHCIVMGIASVRADLTYQQGINRSWLRSTRYDYYWPEFANLGEQPVTIKELFWANGPADNEVFGYQERYAEYRYKPSMITGLFRSDAPSSLESWHLSQDLSAPLLNQTFIEEDVPLDRAIETPAEPHFIGDFFFNLQCARPMPLYSVPGLSNHF